MATAFQNLVPRIMGDLILDFGLTPIQAAGLVGNLAHESAGFTAMQEKNPIGGGQGGLGWAQWTGPRRRSFEAWARQKGFPIDSYAANYGYLKAELSGEVPGSDYRHAITQLKKTSTIQAATETFEAFYERAGVKNMPSRVKWANRAYDIWKNVKPPTPVYPGIYMPESVTNQFITAAQLAKLQNSGTVLSQDQVQALLSALLGVKAWVASVPALKMTGEPAPMPSVYNSQPLQASSPAQPPSSGDLPEPKQPLQTKRIQGLAIAAIGLIGGAIAKKWFPGSEGVLQSFLVDYGGEITAGAGVIWAYIGNRMAEAPIAGTQLAQNICNVKGMLAHAERSPQPAMPQYAIEDADASPVLPEPAVIAAPLDLMTAPIEDVVEQLPQFFERIKRIQSTLNTLNQTRLPEAKSLEAQSGSNEG
jgi:hypothetical protein